MSGITYGGGGASSGFSTGGLANTITAGVQLGTSIYNATAGDLNAKDPGRFAQAQQWYTMALAGDADAECALKYHTALYGTSFCGKYGTSSGFATQVAKDYCNVVYQQYVKVKAGLLPLSTPLPPTPGSSGSGTLSQIGQTAGTIADVASGVATGLGYPTTPLGNTQQTRDRLEIGGLILVALAIGAVVYFAARRK